MDFRGRIYRSGVLHFHERDLAKSVIWFSSDAQSPELSKCEDSSLKRDLLCAAALKYKKWKSLNKSYIWYIDHRHQMNESDNGLIHL